MDLYLTFWINHLRASTFFDEIMRLVSRIPFLIVWSLVLVVIVIYRHRNLQLSVLMMLLISILLSYLVSEVFFKYILIDYTGMRLRPYLAHMSDIIAIGTHSIDSSFPSSHMTFVTAILTVIVYVRHRIWWLAMVCIMIVGFARIHNGMHYPSDVIAGVFLGGCCAWISISIVNNYRPSK